MRHIPKMYIIRTQARVQANSDIRTQARTTTHPNSRKPVTAAARRRGWVDLFLQRMDWRGWTILSVAIAWGAIVALPGLVAVVRHGGIASTSASAWLTSPDANTFIRVYRINTGQIVTLPLANYLINVLAAEMSPNAPLPALEAAAVAARTYAVHALTAPVSTYAKEHGADVTDSPLLDLPWLNTAQQKQRFGSQQAWAVLHYEQAIFATDGQVLTYGGKPILAFTFPLSPGQTRSAAVALGQPLPYLPVVACPDDAKVARQQQTSLTVLEVARLLRISTTSLQANKFRLIPATDGFVQAITYPGHTWTGAQFATSLGLPSADFRLALKGSRLTFTTWGIGSDLGMSLHEDSALAARGDSWQHILSIFYPGTRLMPEMSLLS